MIRRKVLRLFIIFLVVYALVLAGAFMLQRSLMYHPHAIAFDPAQIGGGSAMALETVTAKGHRLRHWFYPPARTSAPVLVFFQGNAGPLVNRQDKIRAWLSCGWGVLLVGYPGFGNEGSPSETALYEAGRLALAALAKKKATGPLVLYGESLGTGIATQMATEVNASALVLEAPYTSFTEVGLFHYPYLPVRALILDRYDTLAKIGRIGVPLFVIHGAADEVVPFEQGRAVFEAAQVPKQSFFPARAGHNNLYDYGAAHALEAFLGRL